MGYRMNEEQRELVKLVDDFFTKEVDPIVTEYDEKGEVPMHVINKGTELGFNRLNFPEEYGGLGLDHRTFVMMIEEMSRHETGVGGTWMIDTMAANLVLAIGNKEQSEYVGQLLSEGKHGSFCLTEPQAGSNAAAITTRADKVGDNYVINGTKCFITNGGIADFFVVMAKTDKEKGTDGISAFLVDRSMGVTNGKEENKLGLRMSNTAEVNFVDVVVPASRLLGEEGRGYFAAMKALETGRVNVAAKAIGIAQRAMEEAARYSQIREAFGKPICRNQGISFMLADMQVNIEAARGLVNTFLDKEERGESITKDGAMCKLFAAEMLQKVTTDAVQIFGGYGCMKEYPVEKLMRDAKLYQITEGTSQIQRMVISKFVLKENKPR